MKKKHIPLRQPFASFWKNIKAKIDAGGLIGAVFLDLRKAFDTVNHQILLTKLSFFNFSLNTLQWIESYIVGKY